MRQHVAPLASPAFIAEHDIREPADLLRVQRLAPNDSWWADWFAAAGVATPLAPSRRGIELDSQLQEASAVQAGFGAAMMTPLRSEEHTSELQSLMRISYAVFCLKKKTKTHTTQKITNKNKTRQN